MTIFYKSRAEAILDGRLLNSVSNAESIFFACRYVIFFGFFEVGFKTEVPRNNEQISLLPICDTIFLVTILIKSEIHFGRMPKSSDPVLKEIFQDSIRFYNKSGFTDCSELGKTRRRQYKLIRYF